MPSSSTRAQSAASAQASASSSPSSAVEILSARLAEFRTWLRDDVGATVHQSLCVVNGEATDGTKNAPVLTLGDNDQYDNRHGSSGSGGAGAASSNQSNNNKGRLGSVGVYQNTGNSKNGATNQGLATAENDDFLYIRSMGCQVRAVRELKKDDVLFNIPRGGMLTPDLMASSDAGRCIVGSIEQSGESSSQAGDGFWGVLGNTTELESSFNPTARNGPQLLVKILRERERAESAYQERLEKAKEAKSNNEKLSYELCKTGVISTRAPFLAFLIHQRFHPSQAPPVVSKTKKSKDQFKHLEATGQRRHITQPPNAPDTFAPYARTLPTAVLLPICWSRNELALLSGCIPGTAFLQEVAIQTMQLVSEFIALLDAGILERFPETFPPGVLTWDRWMWAASVVQSRLLPVTCYLDEGITTAANFSPSDPAEIQSPPEIWDELGVMVPLMDMINHEIDANQLTWEACVPEKEDSQKKSSAGDDDEGDADDDHEPHGPRGILHKRVKKGAEVFSAYGKLSNHNLILQYGMAQVDNTYDEVRISWGLGDSVGKVQPPEDFVPFLEGGDPVFESTDPEKINAWWSEERLARLEKEAFSGPGSPVLGSLKDGKKIFSVAYNDGAYNPILVSATLVATMPKSALHKDDNRKISTRHQKSFRNLLAFIFARKMEKLLQNLGVGLKAHFPFLNLWTKTADGGLKYSSKDDSDKFVGWDTFFHQHALPASIVVEKNLYSMGPDSCVLTLYDGQLKALQLSLDGVVDDAKFKEVVMPQLTDLGYSVNETEEDDDPEEDEEEEPIPDNQTDSSAKIKTENEADKSISEESNTKLVKVKSEGSGGDNSNNNSAEDESGDKKNSPGRKRKNRKKAKENGAPDRPAALKLHVGNLAYSTTPSDLYDFFSSIYGKDNVLECHIPVERETGRSRGFGFVTMPESVAMRALNSGRKFEIAGRLLKVARSNSAGSHDIARPPPMAAPATKDRCVKCGYRPKYCVCSMPSFPHHGPGLHGPPGHGPPPPHLHRPPPHNGHEYGPGDRGPRDDDRHRSDRYREERYMEERYGRVRGYERDYDRPYDRDYGRPYERDYDYDRDRYYRQSSSRSYSEYDREERYRDRKRRDRSRDRSVDSRSSSRRRDDDEGRRRDRRDSDYERRRSRSRSRSPERSRKKKSRKRDA